MEADGKNPTENLDEETDRIRYRRAVQQITELINKYAQTHLERPNDIEWRLQRRKTLETLNDLISKLDTICVGANYGKGIGSGAQVVGDVISIIGAVMALEDSPSAATVMNVGKLINDSGDLVKDLSNLVERHVSAGYLREVKAILDKDKKLSEPLQEWLVFSQNLDANMKIVFGSNLESVIQNNTVKVFSEFSEYYGYAKEFNGTLDNLKRGQFAIHIKDDVPDKLLKFSKELDTFPQLRDTMIEINEWFKLLPAAKDGVKICHNLFRESASTIESLPKDQMSTVSTDFDRMNTIRNVGTVEMAFSNTPPVKAKRPSVTEVSAFCCFQAIDIATGVFSLLSAAKVITDGKSKFSEAIKKISGLLEAELRSMEGLTRLYET